MAVLRKEVLKLTEMVSAEHGLAAHKEALKYIQMFRQKADWDNVQLWSEVAVKLAQEKRKLN